MQILSLHSDFFWFNGDTQGLHDKFRYKFLTFGLKGPNTEGFSGPYKAIMFIFVVDAKCTGPESLLISNKDNFQQSAGNTIK